MNLLSLWKNWNAEPAAQPPAARLKQTGPGPSLAAAPQFEITASLLSDKGCVREINEDRCFFRHPEDAETRSRKGALAIVADGMGGHRAGEVASEMAVRLIEQSYYESQQLPQAALEAAFHKANRAIHQAAQQQPGLSGMGTTATALVIREGTALLAQAGDSRLYLARDGQLYLMSEDHSAVMEMVRLGKMTLDEARLHADKNLLLRALGPQPELRVATWKTPFPVRDGDRFLLCSDGLYDLVSDDEINQAVTNGDPQVACQRLIESARDRGGYDNITVGVVRINVSR
ncbi:MAG: Stp1/IreP family PP2C-type Ser/Thr phosphatase [Blastocatellia bacterium]